MGLRIDVLEGGRIALHSLRGNRLRTALTTMGIGIGVCTLLAIVGIIQGLNTSFAKQLASLGANTIYVSKFPWVQHNDWWRYRNRKDLTLAQLEGVRAQVPLAEGVAADVSFTADVSFLAQHVSGVDLNGTTGDYINVSGFDVANGRYVTDADGDAYSAVVVLGAATAEGLFPLSNPIGATVMLSQRPFRVVGVMGKRGKVLGQDWDLSAFVPLKTYWAYFGKKHPLDFVVSAKKGADMNVLEDQLEVALRRSRSTPVGQEDDFSMNRPEQLANTYAQLTGALFGVAVGVGLITLLVGGIGIMNVMLVSVRERTREIGVRRALGARRRTIVFQFLMEAAAVSLIGGVCGTVAGLSLAKLVAEMTPLAAEVQPLTILFGVGFAGLAGLLFGIWPAARAANLDPVEALRYE